jgi:phospholipid/cholesterol/gamma-HCH transport system substrate-binding protein
MPSPAQVAWAKFRVATMIGCATGILSVLVYLLLGGEELFQPAAPVHTFMSDLAGLEKGAPVRFNGVRAGEVTQIALSGLNDPQKVVRVDMSIMNRFLKSIPEDSTTQIAAETVLGDKFVDINEGKSAQHVQAGGELLSPPPKKINNADLIKAGKQILAAMDSLLGDIEAGRGEIGQFVKGDAFYNTALNQVTKFQKDIRAATNRDTQVGKLIYDDQLYENLEKAVKRLDQTLADWQEGRGAEGKFLKDAAQYDQLRKAARDLSRTLEDVRSAKLIKDDELYTRASRLVDNLNAQVEALNSGSGMLGQLLISSTTYENLVGSTNGLRNMLKELRENPKKFLWMKLF